MKNFLIGLAIANMQALGFMLRSQDADSTGADDGVGVLLTAAAPVLQTFAAGGGESKTKVALKAAADAIYTFLGLTPAQ